MAIIVAFVTIKHDHLVYFLCSISTCITFVFCKLLFILSVVGCHKVKQILHAVQNMLHLLAIDTILFFLPVQPCSLNSGFW